MGGTPSVQSNGSNQARPSLTEIEQQRRAGSFSDTLAMQAGDLQAGYEKDNYGRGLPQQHNENGKHAYARCEVGAPQAMNASDDYGITKWWNRKTA